MPYVTRKGWPERMAFEGDSGVWPCRVAMEGNSGVLFWRLAERGSPKNDLES